ncbi:MAG: AAA family ATPase [Myxococcales bacterium]|nr:AAA family ATPase [Myxococcales bacterium]
MALTLELRPLIVVREYTGGVVYAFPLAAPGLVTRARSAEAAIERLTKFLSKSLAKLPADALAEYVYPEDASVLDLPVILPRSDLPRRVKIEREMVLPCVVVPDDDARWVHVLPLGHMVLVRPGESLERRVRDEILRVASARTLVASEYKEMLPADRHALARPEVAVERGNLEDLGARSAKRRAKERARAEKAAKKLLDKVGRALSRGADATPIIAREREVRSLGALLAGDERLSVMLVGDEMTGKTAIIDALLSRPGASARPIYATSGAQLVAGQSGFGQLEERLDAVLKAAELLDVVLYFDDFGDLFAGHSGGIEDLASIMRPYLVEGRVRVLGELTPELVEQHEKRHVGFFACLHRIPVKALDAATTRALLEARAQHARAHEPTRPTLADDAIEPLVSLSERYLRYQAFPGKAVRLYEELRATLEAELAAGGERRSIDARHVYAAFSTRSGIPMFLLREERRMKYDSVVEFFRRHVIGQDEAIRRVAETLCAVKSGLQPPGKPLANFLFVGPTGVGKTEVAKTLARFLFSGADRLVRFDMSEYMDPLAAERLIRGTQRDEGELTRRVRQQPFCVVLLDEIEKAHPAVFDLLLQVCGEGRLTDARGRTTHFENAIIIMTSNLGAAHRRPRSGFGLAARAVDDQRAEQQHYLERVDAHFRPEFVNRIDRVIPFRSLTRAEIRDVAGVALARIRERAGLLNRGVTLRLSARALEGLAAAGYSDAYGARALRRHLEDTLVAPLAGRLSRHANELENATVRVFLGDEQPADAGEPGGASVLGGALGGADVGGEPLRFDLSRPPSGEQRQSTHLLARVAQLRRMAASTMRWAPIVEMQERVDYLVAEMATAHDPERRAARAHDESARARGPVDIARMTAEHARLRELLTGLREELEAIEGAEDLALIALHEGEDSEPYRAEAQAAYERFEKAYVRAVLGQVGGAGAALILQPQDDPWTLHRWLEMFLEGAARRDWQLRLHLWEQAPDPALGDDWPEGLPWGPPRERPWIEQQLARISEDPKAGEKTLATEWRGALLCVHGDHASALLRFELGLQRFDNAKKDEPPAHLLIRWAAGRYALGPDELRRPPASTEEREAPSYAYELPDRSPRDQLLKLEPTRHFREGRPPSVALPSANLYFNLYDEYDYWDRYEHIVFALIADPLAAGDDPIPEEDEL